MADFKKVVIVQRVTQVTRVAPTTIKSSRVAQAVINVPVPGPQGPQGLPGTAFIPDVLDGGNF